VASGQHGALSFQDTKDMKILVTGASGFVGKSSLVAFRDCGHEVTAASRSRVEQPGIFYVRSPEPGPKTDLASSDSSRLGTVQSERYREKNIPFFRSTRKYTHEKSNQAILVQDPSMKLGGGGYPCCSSPNCFFGLRV
jgi:hypothetical protein